MAATATIRLYIFFIVKILYIQTIINATTRKVYPILYNSYKDITKKSSFIQNFTFFIKFNKAVSKHAKTNIQH